MKLTVTLIQMQVAQSQPDKNMERAEPWIADAARNGSDWICFPEMWTTGFAWADLPRLADRCGRQAERLAVLARQYGIWITGSMLVRNAETGHCFNSAVLFNAAGNCVAEYRKTHLFGGIGEDRYLTPGDHLVTADTPWGRVGFTICYDLRFPELFRTYALQGVDIITVPAAFPLVRRMHWQTLLRARAIENQLFIIGVNQSGREHTASEMAYAGASCVIDPLGQVLAEAGEQEERFTVTMDMDERDRVRKDMKVFSDRRPDLYRLL